MEDIEVTHNLFITKEYKPFSAIGFIYAKATKNPGSLGFGNKQQYSIPLSGQFVGDMFFSGEFVGAQSADIAQPATVARDMIRYCNIPSARLFKETELLFDGVEIQKYDRMAFIHYLNHELPKEKLPKLIESLGQEKQYQGEVNPHPGFSEYKMNKSYSIGPQTYKLQHPSVKFIHPLIFWFNLDSSQVLLNQNIDRISIRVELEEVAQLVEKLGVGTNGPITYPTLDSLDLWYKDIYVPREIHEIYIKQKAFEVISTWRFDSFTINSSIGSTSLNPRNWPLERLYMSYIPATTEANFQNWYKGYVLTARDIPEFVSVVNPTAPPTYIIDTQLGRFYEETRPIDSLTIETYTIKYYIDMEYEFFSNYNGSTDFNERIYPSSSGSMMVNFDYKPGEKNTVSGYSSTSNNTDFVLGHNSSYFNTVNIGTLYTTLKVLDALIIDVKLLELRFNA